MEMMQIMIGHEIFDTSLSFQSGRIVVCESSTLWGGIQVCISSNEVFTSDDKCVNIFGRLCLLDAKVPKLGIEAYKYPTQ